MICLRERVPANLWPRPTAVPAPKSRDPCGQHSLVARGYHAPAKTIVGKMEFPNAAKRVIAWW